MSEQLIGAEGRASQWKSKNSDYWRRVLGAEQYRVCREGGTELPFSGKYNHEKRGGKYLCSSCRLPLFSSETKFDSGSGWPSFWEGVDSEALELLVENSLGMQRIEVKCSRCGAHLGHVFNDGPAPTGKRYCINSVCLLHEQDVKD